jgi:hypothetical protein
MKPTGPTNITHSAVAPFLRSGCALPAGGRVVRNSHHPQIEVISHNYGTHQKESCQGGPESLLTQADARSGRRAERSQPRRDGRLGKTSQPLRTGESLAAISRAATFFMGSHGAVSAHRRGNETREGLGEEEAGVRQTRRWVTWSIFSLLSGVMS